MVKHAIVKTNMLKANKLYRNIILVCLVVIAAVAILIWYLHSHTIAVLQPSGQIGRQERQLMWYALILALVVIVPVYGMTFVIAMKYREGNKKKKKYSPNFDHHRGIEFVWWAIPLVIIGVLAVITWRSSHQLDPYKPLNSQKKPLTIQVVALDWKWLFIYPSQHIATVNYVQFPANTPIDFEITSDTVMSSFWIPQLGGQIYAMPGMNTHLHLVADKNGDFAGSSANINGKGFSGMKFAARATSDADFSAWVQRTQHAAMQLDQTSYQALAKPSENNPWTYYRSPQADLYTTIIDKYMMPDHAHNSGAY
jgi:cytochrome o ubiquinol oxidase subunit 2